MKITLMAGAAALVVAFAASGAEAGSPDGWYGAIDAGYHTLSNDGIGESSSALAPDGGTYNYKFSAKGDWVGFARLGYRLSPNWRVELEGGYRKGQIDSVMGWSGRQQPVGLCAAGVTRTVAAPACLGPNGDLDNWTVMGNVLFDILPHSKISPFVGVGVGVATINEKTFGQFSGVPAGFGAAQQNLSISATDTVFAYQGLAGLTWDATDRLSVDLTYRYLDTANAKFASTGSGTLQPGTFV